MDDLLELAKQYQPRADGGDDLLALVQQMRPVTGRQMHGEQQDAGSAPATPTQVQGSPHVPLEQLPGYSPFGVLDQVNPGAMQGMAASMLNAPTAPTDTIRPYEPPQRSPAMEFGRSAVVAAAREVPPGLPGGEAARDWARVQQPPQGIAGGAGQFIGGMAGGIVNTQRIPENVMMFGTGAKLVESLAPVLEKIASPIARRAVAELIQNAPPGAGIAAAQQAARDDWENDPAGALGRTIMAAGAGGAAAGGVGAGLGALGARGEAAKAKATAEGAAFQDALRGIGRPEGAIRTPEPARGVTPELSSSVKNGEVANVQEEGRQAQGRPQGLLSQTTPETVTPPGAISTGQVEGNDLPPSRAPVAGAEAGPNLEQGAGAAVEHAPSQAATIDASGQLPNPQDLASMTYADLRAEAKRAGVWDQGAKTKAELVKRIQAAREQVPPTASSSAEPPLSPQPETTLHESASAPGGTPSADGRGSPDTRDSPSLPPSPRPEGTPKEPSELARGIAKLASRKARAPKGSYEKLLAEHGYGDARPGEHPITNVINEAILSSVDGPVTAEFVQSRLDQMPPEKWQTPLAQFIEQRASFQGETGARHDHRTIVERALSEGRPVPPEVLAEYPDLAGKAKPHPALMDALEQVQNMRDRKPYVPQSDETMKALRDAGLTDGPKKKPKVSEEGRRQLFDYVQDRRSTSIAEGNAFDKRQGELVDDIEAGRPISKADAAKYFDEDSDWLKWAVIADEAAKSPPQPRPPAAGEPATPKVAEPAPKAPDATPKVAEPPPPEPTKGPKLSGDDEGHLTALKNAMTERDRQAFGLDALDGPTRRSFAQNLKEADAQGIPAKSLDIAASIIEKPRPITAIENAGMTKRLVEAKNAHRAAVENFTAAKDPADQMTAIAEMNRRQQEIDVLTEAAKLGGTESGRALQARQMALAEDYSPAIVKAKARVAKGSALTPERAGMYDEVTKRLAEVEKQVAEFAQTLKEQQAEQAVRRQTSGRRRTPQARDAEYSSLLAEAKALLEQGCN